MICPVHGRRWENSYWPRYFLTSARRWPDHHQFTIQSNTPYLPHHTIHTPYRTQCMVPYAHTTHILWYSVYYEYGGTHTTVTDRSSPQATARNGTSHYYGA